ncbi:discoidin domain-containing receptor 2-like isoform X2 [Amphibalanus amphitrite]|uniref:discoidin domain-containing receptor 2-like isoform X2 n=1 Tax=Amphibalanus amphitrite TaxID=1232801 RepID=UPI001C912BF2|nr:discoidin domain-containing receptor 2-like isoform X2 [Amphibalanus amphitrite]
MARPPMELSPRRRRLLLLQAIVTCWSIGRSDALTLDQCDHALGMESGEINDHQISAWCPQPVITSQVHEYLQIDLGRVTVVTAAETQGRFGNGRGVEWAEKYALQYWRPGAEGDTGWRTYRNASGHTVMDGNVNSYMAHKTVLNPPLIASKVRVVPKSDHPRTVCLRAELHGCRYTAGIDSYSMDVPDARWPDLTYDGVGSAKVMKNGLGQLTDGHVGNNDITRPEWVGWRRTAGQTVTITFRFSGLRELEAATFFVSNHFTANARIFSEAALRFSLDGEVYTDTAVKLRPDADRIFEDSRELRISLHRQVARFVRIDLTAADTWTLISEINFEGAPSTANITHLVAAGGAAAAGGDDGAAPPPGPAAADAGGSAAPLAVILGVLGLVLLLLSALVGYVVRAGRRRKVAGGPSPTPLPLPRTLNMKELRLNMHLAAGPGYARSHGDVYGPLPAEEDKVGLCGSEPYRVVRLNPDYNTTGQRTARRDQRTPDTSYDYAVPVDNDTPPPPFTDCVPAAGRSPADPWDNPSYKQSPSGTTQSSSQPSLCNLAELLPPPPLPPPPPEPPAAATLSRRRRVLARSVEGVTGTCVWQTRRADVGLADVREVGADMIKRREKIGEGRFGEIFSCEVHFPSSPDSPYQAPSRLVSARCLRTSATGDAACRLRAEAEPLSRVSDPHVTRLLGVCTMDESPCLLVEYMERGDLNQFLRRTQLDPGRPSQRPLEYGSLIYMATQVAAGMKHLETLGIVHRDLAARNCLVGHQLQVKVGDLGPSRAQYASDYVTLPDGRVVPLRWHAPEALFTEQCSSSSDVWSFSVTLWEILTWCRLQPLAHLSDAAVTDRLASYLPPVSCAEQLLQQPNVCPREIFDLMCECWRVDPTARPTFGEIHMFLQRKNLGFEPVTDGT